MQSFFLLFFVIFILYLRVQYLQFYQQMHTIAISLTLIFLKP